MVNSAVRSGWNGLRACEGTKTKCKLLTYQILAHIRIKFSLSSLNFPLLSLTSEQRSINQLTETLNSVHLFF